MTKKTSPAPRSSKNNSETKENQKDFSSFASKISKENLSTEEFLQQELNKENALNNINKSFSVKEVGHEAIVNAAIRSGLFR